MNAKQRRVFDRAVARLVATDLRGVRGVHHRWLQGWDRSGYGGWTRGAGRCRAHMTKRWGSQSTVDMLMYGVAWNRPSARLRSLPRTEAALDVRQLTRQIKIPHQGGPHTDAPRLLLDPGATGTFTWTADRPGRAAVKLHADFPTDVLIERIGCQDRTQVANSMMLYPDGVQFQVLAGDVITCTVQNLGPKPQNVAGTLGW